MLQFKVRSQRQQSPSLTDTCDNSTPEADPAHPEETCTGLWAEGPGGVKEVKRVPRIHLASSLT